MAPIDRKKLVNPSNDARKIVSCSSVLLSDLSAHELEEGGNMKDDDAQLANRKRPERE